MTYRKDINGIRAIGLIAVVLYHFEIPGFDRCFGGLDLFYFISGFLMTNIIFSRLRKDRFSFLEFYAYRCRRIIPALAILCLAIIVFGFFYLQTHDYKNALTNVRKSIQFISNIAYYRDIDYFATPSKENWLLHTWSLSIEWQFYILYPIIILSLSKFFEEKAIKWIFVALTTISLVFCIYYTPLNNSAAYYLLPTRAWELLSGSLIYLYPIKLKEKPKTLIHLIGIIFIIITLFGLSPEDAMSWPGYLALVPIMGSALIVIANKKSIITDNVILQFLGNISYSVYLWHWPIAVWFYLCDMLHTYYVIYGIIVSLILGTLSYFFVETKFKINTTFGKEVIKYLIVILAISGLASIMSVIAKKYPNLRPQSLAKVKYNEWVRFYPTNCSNGNDCVINPNKTPISYIVWGDSHSVGISNSVYFANPKITGIHWGVGGCLIMQGYKYKDPRAKEFCSAFLKEKFEILAHHYLKVPLLIVNGHFLYTNPFDQTGHFIYFNEPVSKITDDFIADYTKHYIDTMCKLAKNRPVYVLKPIPTMDIPIQKTLFMQSILLSKIKDINISMESYLEKNKIPLQAMAQASQKCGIKLLDPIPYLCPNGKQCIGTLHGVPYYFDDNHININGMKKLEPLFKNLINKSVTTTSHD